MVLKLYKIVSTIYFGLCLSLLAIGTVATSLAVKYPAPPTFINTESSFSLVIDNDQELANYSIEELKTFRNNNLQIGQSFFIYRHYCANPKQNIEVQAVRYLEAESRDAHKVIIPLTVGSMIIPTRREGIENNCFRTIFPVQIPKNIVPGSYMIKSYITYRNMLGTTKVFVLDDIPITVVKK